MVVDFPMLSWGNFITWYHFTLYYFIIIIIIIINIITVESEH